ncbi:MAG: hypothetical protein O8C64_01115 [Candidatus Methanoperedens sp.]|nr:hypothetical protein [Candidatus Methanoperedens sp.]
MELKWISAKNRRIATRTLYAGIGFIGILLAVGILFTLLPFNSNVASAVSASNGGVPGTDNQNMPMMGVVNNTQKYLDAVRIANENAASRTAAPGSTKNRPPLAPFTPGTITDYFGDIPNYANSPAPTIDPVSMTISGGIRKFVDSLPRVGPNPVNGSGLFGANNLGKYIPLATADNSTYPGSDYYEIGLVQYTEKMHSDLNNTTLRGYVQIETAANVAVSNHIPLYYPNGTSIVNATGGQVLAVDNPHYLGPLVLANKDRPVRVKFTNYLPNGAGGNLFIPVDTSVMGAGPYEINATSYTDPTLIDGNFSQNRATLHLHGGTTPWISDGTQHQWITPAGENTSYPKGVSVAYVPDMWFNASGVTVAAGTAGATNNPGNGSLTFYYTNQQSARLMFYHDHAYGITRLNVYAGEAAGYLLQDDAESALIANGTIPALADNIPLIIQDKAFLPDNHTLETQDPTWPFTVNASRTDLWLPHVYMPNQNPADISGANPFGRWDYGPWFFPPQTNLTFGPVANPLSGTTAQEGPVNPGIPNPSIVPEAFVDTPIVNGNAYPNVTLGQKAYRLRILNAANDRSLNLQLYYASTAGPFVVLSGGDGSGASATATVNSTGSITGISVSSGGVGYYTTPPTVTIFDAPGHLPNGSGATATATIDTNSAHTYTYGTVTGITLTANGSNYSVPTICNGTAVLNQSLCTEVSMVPAALNSSLPFPASWLERSLFTLPPDIMDNRFGGIPDPRTIGPSFVQIGTEGGFLPAPVVIESRPVGFEKNMKSITVTNVLEKALFMGPAERADVIVDFANVLNGSTLILYNDAPAAVPAADTRNDYFTDDMNQTSTGGAPSTIPGYGPNTRTIMQIQINGGYGNMSGNASGFNLTNLTAQLPAAYAQYQPKPLVPQSDYDTAFNGTYPTDAYARIHDHNMTFLPAADSHPVRSITINASGSGYDASTVNVNITGGNGTNATATATLNGTGSITGITVTNGGSGYNSTPTVIITGGNTSSATATATLNLTMDMQPKAIHELFDPNYGRMNALLGVELPLVNWMTQTTIVYGDIDPPTELFNYSDSAAAIGTLGDGTQIWKITHNGVDTHAIHWHMINVQVINRVGWDGAVKPPDANELGWKETVRMNPLEDVIIATRPIKPVVPFDLPNSIRPLDVTMPLNSTGQFGVLNGIMVDPTNEPVTVSNHLINYGWEYVWHCHLLGHEENIMMRSMLFAVTPYAPFNMTANSTVDLADSNYSNVTMRWTDNSTNEINWIVQRATTSNGTWTTLATVPSTTQSTNGTLVTYNDTIPNNTVYYYRVNATNIIGDLTVYTAPAVGFPDITVDSGQSNIAPSNGTTLPVAVTYANASPSTIVNDNGRPRYPGTNITNLTVTVTGTVASVTVNLTPIGGSATTAMNRVIGTNNWTLSTNATAGINLTSNLVVTATGSGGDVNNTVSMPLTVLRLGDVVRNDRVNAADGYYILRYTVGRVAAPSTLVGDVNADGVVNSADAYYILRYTVGLVSAP